MYLHFIEEAAEEQSKCVAQDHTAGRVAEGECESCSNLRAFGLSIMLGYNRLCFTVVHFSFSDGFLEVYLGGKRPCGCSSLLFLATVGPGFTGAQVASPKDSAILTLSFLEVRATP